MCSLERKIEIGDPSRKGKDATKEISYNPRDSVHIRVTDKAERTFGGKLCNQRPFRQVCSVRLIT